MRCLNGHFLACWGIWLLSVMPATAMATQAEEMELKAAFIYNFTLFTTWPHAKDHLLLCVLGNEKYDAPLGRYEGRKVFDATLSVRHVREVEEGRACDVLFVDRSEYARLDQARKTLEGLPVLTVTEYGSATPSSMIVLYRESNRVVFEIDRTAAANAGLVFSHKLLKLARKVK